MTTNRLKRRRSDDVDYSSNHPTTIPLPSLPVADEKPKADPSGAPGLLGTLQRHIDDLRNHIYCGVCRKPLYEPYTLSCGHTFCYSCLVQWFTSHGQSKTCPDCRSPVRAAPAPAYLVRNIVHMFIGRSELTDANETTHEHLANQVAETERVESDKRNTDPEKGGLFQGCFGKNRDKAPIQDDLEDVVRCPNCFWELEYGTCEHCGFINGSVSDDFDSDEDDDLDDDALDRLTEDEDDLDDFVIRDDDFVQFAFAYGSDQPYMDFFAGDHLINTASLDGSSTDNDLSNESEASDDASDASSSSHSTVRGNSVNHSPIIELDDVSSVQEILSNDEDSDEDPIRPAPARRTARARGRQNSPEFSLHTNNLHVRFRAGRAPIVERGSNPLSALVIEDSSPPHRPARRRRVFSPRLN